MTAPETLRALGACNEAIKWAEAHGGALAELWRDCPRGDWLLWYASRSGAPIADLVRAAAACAELALPYAGKTRAACEAAISAARAWADAPSEANRAAANAAAYAADAVADAARAVYAANATYAARSAHAAACAANAANAANAADAAYAAGNTARDEMRRKCADAVRGCVEFGEVRG